MVQTALQHFEAGRDLSLDEVVETFDQIVSGHSSEETPPAGCWP